MKSFLATVLVFLVGAAFAQDTPKPSKPQRDPAAQARFEALVARIQDLQRRHTITVRGAENPSALRRGAVLTLFFAQHGPADDASFALFALERYGATGPDVDVLKAARDTPDAAKIKPNVDVCVRVLDGSLLDGLSIATYITEVDESADRHATAYYQGIIDKLSPPVRANVLRKIDEDAVGVAGGNLDHLGMAREDPELYKTMITGFCRGKKQAVAASQADSTSAVSQDNVSSDFAR